MALNLNITTLKFLSIMTSINKVDIKFYAVYIRDYTISGYTPKTPAQYFWSIIESDLSAVLLRIYSEMTSEKGRARILARYRRIACYMSAKLGWVSYLLHLNLK
jgi:hypothetical protein